MNLLVLFAENQCGITTTSRYRPHS